MWVRTEGPLLSFHSTFDCRLPVKANKSCVKIERGFETRALVLVWSLPTPPALK